MKNHYIAVSILCSLGMLSTQSKADTQYHRLVWDADPARQAVIGFSPDGSSQNPYVSYGTSTDESQWQRVSPQSQHRFSSLDSYFVRLSGLTPNTPVYYRVCDNQGCGQRFWFRTAPIDNSPFVAIAGGDTRTGWTNRRAGNELVAKVRPLFVMHGGDFTNANSATEMKAFLQDWSLSFSDDLIDGQSYKRIYPLLPTHGNHEDGNYSTLCEVFGVDGNADSQCNPHDTYNAFNVSPLLRVYTLNSQFKDSGWSAYAAAMNTWLSEDLAEQGASATWRFAQYHKPMFPHYTGKSDNTELFAWWADDFYNHAMNLVVESDTHITKITQAIKPNGNGFSETTEGGTVYVGEGSWGAPARSANDPKSWTIDLASIQQFKVIKVQPATLEVGTAQFTDSASRLTREERIADPLVLPDNIDWWSAAGVGEVLKLKQNADRRTYIDTDSAPGNSMRLNASGDTYIASGKPDTNFNGSSSGLLADGSDGSNGELRTLLRFDLSQVPNCAAITKASLEISVFNRSSGTYKLASSQSQWDETSATWNNLGPDPIGTEIANFTPSATGKKIIPFSSQGLEAISQWRDGNNNGLVIYSAGSSDGIDINAREMGSGPVLVLEYEEAEVCSPPDDSALENGIPKPALAANQGSAQYFYIDVPTGASNLNVAIEGGSGDADLYLKFATPPTQSNYDCRPWRYGNNESCTVNAPQAGRYHIMLYGYDDYRDVSLTARYTPSLK